MQPKEDATFIALHKALCHGGRLDSLGRRKDEGTRHSQRRRTAEEEEAEAFCAGSMQVGRKPIVVIVLLFALKYWINFKHYERIDTNH